MRKTIFLILILLTYSVVSIYAQNAPKYSNEFLNIGVGARALAMSNSQVAIANDVTAGYWNPAGLLDIEARYEGALMHAEYFAGIAQYDYAAFATPIDSMSHLGISLIRFGVDDIPDTRFLYDADGRINYDNIRFFSAADYALLLSYARRLSWLQGLKFGANFKVIYRNAGNFANAWGLGLDAGLQLDRGKWHFGLMVRDITGTFNAWSHNASLVFDVFAQTGNEIPENSIEVTLPKAILGVARELDFSENLGLLLSADIVSTFDGSRNVLIENDPISLDASFGLELDYKHLVFLRGGVGNFQQIKNFDGTTNTDFQPNFGLGLKIKQFSIDYALTDIGNQSEALYSHVFSLKGSF